MNTTSSEDTLKRLASSEVQLNLLPNLQQQGATSRNGGRRQVYWNALKTHCKNGHEFTPENTYRHGNGRACRTCAIARASRHQLRPEIKLKKSLKAKLERKTHPEKERAISRRYHSRHRDNIILRIREYKKTHRDELRQKLQHYRKTHVESVRENRLRYTRGRRVLLTCRRYRITIDHYNQMLSKQNNLCAICSKELIKPHLDHNHSTGKVRAFLCPRCNLFVGMIETRGNDALKAAQEYIARYA